MKRFTTEGEKTVDLLEKILRVLSLQVGVDKSITEKVYLLKSVGIDNETIANVLGTTSATVRTLYSLSIKKGRKK